MGSGSGEDTWCVQGQAGLEQASALNCESREWRKFWKRASRWGIALHLCLPGCEAWGTLPPLSPAHVAWGRGREATWSVGQGSVWPPSHCCPPLLLQPGERTEFTDLLRVAGPGRVGDTAGRVALVLLVPLAVTAGLPAASMQGPWTQLNRPIWKARAGGLLTDGARDVADEGQGGPWLRVPRGVVLSGPGDGPVPKTGFLPALGTRLHRQDGATSKPIHTRQGSRWEGGSVRSGVSLGAGTGAKPRGSGAGLPHGVGLWVTVCAGFKESCSPGPQQFPEHLLPGSRSWTLGVCGPPCLTTCISHFTKLLLGPVPGLDSRICHPAGQQR